MYKPIRRSKVRLFVGHYFFALKKLLYWHVLGINFAKTFASPLPIEITSHQTVLRRRLRNVDMWMQENKIVNLNIAVKQLNGLVIHPGQTFSYWRQIGKPTQTKGYLEGMVLHDGTVTSGVGGGLCQLSNLLYWMTLHTPLSIIERWRHSYDVFPDTGRKQPFGSGATCAYPNIDLQIKNNTRQTFQLSLEVTDEYLIGKWLSDKPIEFRYEVFEKDHEIKHEWFGGYSRNNRIFRKVIDKQTDEVLHEELVAENHALMMYNPLLGTTDRSQYNNAFQ